MDWPYPRFSGDENMRLDAERLAEAERTGRLHWRVYGWEGPWITLGRYQSPERDLILPCPAPWSIRPTGGKAVLHGHDVTVGIAAPLILLGPDETALARSIRAVYRAAIAPMIEAMRACGLPAALAENTRFVGQGTRTADCFAHNSPNDVVDERTGLKVCGCALKLTQKAVLIQASLPAVPPLIDPRSAIREAKPVTALAWEHGRYGEALEEALRAAWG